MPTLKKPTKCVCGSKDLKSEWIAKAVQIGDWINEQFKQCLDNCIGKIIADA